MQAILLAGGLGTRLKTVVPHLPKPLAPIQGRPFLAYLLTYLKKQGFDRIILATHFMHEKFVTCLDTFNPGLKIILNRETELLGTGGAILNALQHTNEHEPVFVLNGDTFVELDYLAMWQQHHTQASQLTIALQAEQNSARYGQVVVANMRIIKFLEKESQSTGWINAGIYLFAPNILQSLALPKRFSFEREFIVDHLDYLQPHAFFTQNYFIDIGIPEDYARAEAELTSKIHVI